MNAEQLNIDDFVNYETEYRAIIKGAKPSGGNLVGRCPFHDDKKKKKTKNKNKNKNKHNPPPQKKKL